MLHYVSLHFNLNLLQNHFERQKKLEEIIKFFREELYPEDIEISIGDEGNMVSVGYRFPKKFQIDTLYDNKPVPDTKIKPCFLRDVSVVYNPTNQTMHGGDNPHFTEIDMSLAFTETRTLSRKDVDAWKGFNGAGNYFKNFGFAEYKFGDNTNIDLFNNITQYVV